MTRWFLIPLLGGSLAASGCSMALSGPSPERPRGKAPQCDTSKGLVFVDALLASTLGIVAASVGSNNGGEAVIPLIGAGVFVASAVHGNNVVNDCNRELANYDAELASMRPALNPYGESPRPVVAMQPAMAPQPQPQPQPLVSRPVAPPPAQQQPAPPPAQQQPAPPPAQQQPAPPPAQQPPAPQPSSTEPWAAFWKETP